MTEPRTAERIPAPTCQPVRRGFGALPCPACGAAEASISIDLDDLTGDEACVCGECSNHFCLDHVRDIIAKWGKILQWIDSAPVME